MKFYSLWSAAITAALAVAGLYLSAVGYPTIGGVIFLAALIMVVVNFVVLFFDWKRIIERIARAMR